MSRNEGKLFGDAVKVNHRWQQPIKKWSRVGAHATTVPCQVFHSSLTKSGNRNVMKSSILVDVIKIRKNQERNANKSISLKISNRSVLTKKLELFGISTKNGSGKILKIPLGLGTIMIEVRLSNCIFSSDNQRECACLMDIRGNPTIDCRTKDNIGCVIGGKNIQYLGKTVLNGKTCKCGPRGAVDCFKTCVKQNKSYEPGEITTTKGNDGSQINCKCAPQGFWKCDLVGGNPGKL